MSHSPRMDGRSDKRDARSACFSYRSACFSYRSGSFCYLIHCRMQRKWAGAYFSVSVSSFAVFPYSSNSQSFIGDCPAEIFT